MVVECVGLSLPPPILPKLVHEGVNGPAHLVQPDFVSPPLSDIWQCVDVLSKKRLASWLCEYFSQAYSPHCGLSESHKWCSGIYGVIQ